METPQMEVRVRQQAAVARLGLRALGGIDVRALAEEVLAEACSCLRTPMAAALEIHDGRTSPLVERGVRLPAEIRGGAAGSPAGLLLASRMPVVVEDLATDGRFSRSPVMEAAGARSCAAVLVQWGSDNLATLAVLDVEPRRFSAGDVDFLQSLANVLAAAMQRARQERAAEQALRQSEEKLRQSQKIEAVGRLAGGIAHDFNNLLTAILTTVQLAITDLAPDHPVRGDLDDIRGAAEKAANLTRQLLAFSRRQVLRPRVLDLGAAVTDMQKMLGRLIGEDIRVVAEVGTGCTVCADPGQIEQVILNLALNARDAMPRGGTLSLRTCPVELTQEDGLRMFGCPIPRGGYVQLRVEDTGAGMDAHTMERIFEPFFTTKELGKGTGLGLATVYGIVKQSGGYIRATSTVGQGSTFEVYLPVVGGAPADYATPIPQETPVGRGEMVLLVEDEDAVRMAARKALARCGFNVVEARNGKEALQRFGERGPVDLVVSDLVMPEMGGRELATKLREDAPRLKVLFTSGYTDDAGIRKGALDSGMGFLSKPFTPEALVRKAREMLDQPS
jgi:two-component system cell cycle sensor histidine kinase/response regulator CckA